MDCRRSSVLPPS
ncbi:hypothetical protein P8C59_005814 [Phyllachora maydis]|uniref:Uncharacterized protein n=1 Tax=Phyllachora maydis TaxID=1825666 RepID=A0AAD9MDW4_9PEZI|nr:hypothetical protein P8C59_005814 [Phyllachora maydis]